MARDRLGLSEKVSLIIDAQARNSLKTADVTLTSKDIYEILYGETRAGSKARNSYSVARHLLDQEGIESANAAATLIIAKGWSPPGVEALGAVFYQLDEGIRISLLRQVALDGTPPELACALLGIGAFSEEQVADLVQRSRADVLYKAVDSYELSTQTLIRALQRACIIGAVRAKRNLSELELAGAIGKELARSLAPELGEGKAKLVAGEMVRRESERPGRLRGEYEKVINNCMERLEGYTDGEAATACGLAELTGEDVFGLLESAKEVLSGKPERKLAEGAKNEPGFPGMPVA